MPKPGEPGSETWQGKDIEHGGAPTWFTGSYDPALDLVYWPTGNPGKEYNGDDRKGDNLYANSIVALDRKSGKLRWALPVHPARSVGLGRDADLGPRRCRLGGRPRRLMLHASRNGFFYVFDRENGKLLLAKPFVQPDLGQRDRRRRPPDQVAEPGSNAGRHEGLSVAGWCDQLVLPSTIRRPAWYYLQTFEKCSIYTKAEQGEWESGKTYLGGSQKTAPDPKSTGPPRARHPHRHDQMGSAAAGPRVLMGADALDGHGPRDLWRRGRRPRLPTP